jgi:hypothetical protein
LFNNSYQKQFLCKDNNNTTTIHHLRRVNAFIKKILPLQTQKCTRLCVLKNEFMRVITTREFREHQRSYFDLAEKERVIIKRGKKLVELRVREKLDDSLSPSEDIWFENPDNIAVVLKGLEDTRNGDVTKIEDLKNIWVNIL